MVQDAFAKADDIHEEQQDIEDPALPDDDNSFETTGDMEILFKETRRRLFRGCKTNRLKFIIIILTICSVYNIPYSFLDELLRFLAADVLPRGNWLPKTSYECRTLLMKMGLKHNDIDCCPDGHMLFWKKNKNLEFCTHPGCGKRRYMPGTKIPVKVARYFSIIKRLQRLFKCPEIAKLFSSHILNQSKTSVMSSVIDSPVWKWILWRWGDLARDPRFIRLALILDGVNPVVEELLELWNGVRTVDCSSPDGPSSFDLKGILMWTIGDFPALGLTAEQVTKGYAACPRCGEET